MSAILEPELEVMSRVVAPDDSEYAVEAAKAVLALCLAERDRERMAELGTEAQERRLTAEEQGEVEVLRRVENWLIKMKSKARRTLAKTNS